MYSVDCWNEIKMNELIQNLYMHLSLYKSGDGCYSSFETFYFMRITYYSIGNKLMLDVTSEMTVLFKSNIVYLERKIRSSFSNIQDSMWNCGLHLNSRK
jgi:hypothetical protein